jgi:hypothetical protein
LPRPERQQSVLELLDNLRGLDPLKKLFWSELNTSVSMILSHGVDGPMWPHKLWLKTRCSLPAGGRPGPSM